MIKKIIRKIKNYIVSDLFQQSEEFYKTGDYTNAEALLLKILNRNPSHLAALTLFAETASKRKEWTEAVSRWEKVLKAAEASESVLPSQAQSRLESARLYLAREFYRLGEYSNAEALLQKLLTRNPSHLAALTLFAETASKRKEWTEAVSRWEKVLKTADATGSVPPSQAQSRLENAQLKLSQEYLKSGELETSVSILKHMVDQNPNNREAFYELINIYNDKELWLETIECYKIILQIERRNVTPIFRGLTHCFANIGKPEQADTIAKGLALCGLADTALIIEMLEKYAKEEKWESVRDMMLANKYLNPVVTINKRIETIAENAFCQKGVDEKSKEYKFLSKNHKAIIKQEINDICYEYIYDTLAPYFGYGLETTGCGPKHQPMAYALVAWASANRGDVATACFTADWLVHHSSTGKPGWGLGWEWDAFADGIINSSDTVYGITTAIAVEGLVNVYLLTDDKKYLRSATEALDYYKNFQAEGSGHFYYSDQQNDNKYIVPNITSMFMGQYARLGYILHDERYKLIADKAYQALLSCSKLIGKTRYWKYECTLNERNNDLVHSCYIVYGILIYEKYATTHQSVISQAFQYLTGFIDNDIYEFNPYFDMKYYGKDILARSWGIGMLLYLLSLLKDNHLFELVSSYLYKYEFEKQRFSYRRGDHLHCPRAVAHLLLGLSLYPESNHKSPTYNGE